MRNTIIQGNVFEKIKELPDKYIDCIWTSPPYYALRFYQTQPIIIGGQSDCVHEWNNQNNVADNLRYRGKNSSVGNNKKEDIYSNKNINYSLCQKCGAYYGHFGLESHPNLYIKHLVQLFIDLYPKLKKTANIFVNLGDSFGGSGHGDRGDNAINKTTEFVTGTKQAKMSNNKDFFKPKQKLLIPHRFAIAMQDTGLYICRGDWIWHKTNGMPSSVNDRLNELKEYIFHFVISRKYYFDLDAIKIPCKPLNRWGGNTIKIPEKTKANNNEYSVSYRERNCQSEDMMKNPGDIVKIINSNYSVIERNGIIFFRDLPNLQEIKIYLNKYRKEKDFTIEYIEKEIFKNQAPHHWFNGESYPSKEDWIKLKELLEFDETFDNQMLTEFSKSAEKQDTLTKNPGDILEINTEANSDAHFAIAPTKLVEFCLKAGCSKEVCSKCGKPREKIFNKTGNIISYGGYGSKTGIEQGVSPSSSILTKNIQEKKVIGLTKCNCNEEFIPGIVLDPFMGTGTTGYVAKYLGLSYIGIELNPEYIEIAEKRINKLKKLSENNFVIESNGSQQMLF